MVGDLLRHLEPAASLLINRNAGRAQRMASDAQRLDLVTSVPDDEHGTYSAEEFYFYRVEGHKYGTW